MAPNRPTAGPAAHSDDYAGNPRGRAGLRARPSASTEGGGAAAEPAPMATTGATPTPTLQTELAPLLNAIMTKQATITASAASGQSVTAHLQTIILNIYIVDKPRNNVERFCRTTGFRCVIGAYAEKYASV